MSNTYGITFVGDDVLPPGHDFAFVTTPEGAWIFYRESALCAQTLEDVWAAGRCLRDSGDLYPEADPAAAGARSRRWADAAEDWAGAYMGRAIGWHGLTATTG